MPNAKKKKDIHRAICRLCGKQRMCRDLRYTALRCRKPRIVPVCYKCVSDDNEYPNMAYVITKEGIKVSKIENMLREVINQQAKILAIIGDKFEYLSDEKKEKISKKKVSVSNEDGEKVEKKVKRSSSGSNGEKLSELLELLNADDYTVVELCEKMGEEDKRVRALITRARSQGHPIKNVAPKTFGIEGSKKKNKKVKKVSEKKVEKKKVKKGKKSKKK